MVQVEWKVDSAPALMKLTNNLLIASDSGLISVLVLLDLNTADHNNLLQQLRHAAVIKGTVLIQERLDR